MKILLLYETYSGGTLSASEYLKTILTQKGHDVTISTTHESNPETYKNYDIVIMGTPSWLEQNKEGQPHAYFLQFMDDTKDHQFEGVHFALFGLGDRTYAHFCKAVDTLHEYLTSKKGTVVGKDLKIDSYLFDPEKGKEELRLWVDSLSLFSISHPNQ
jgi:flavodoxin I